MKDDFVIELAAQFRLMGQRLKTILRNEKEPDIAVPRGLIDAMANMAEPMARYLAKLDEEIDV